jgi:hypothetical protein
VPLGPRLESLLRCVESGIPIDPRDVGLIADYEELEARELVMLHRHLSGSDTERYLFALFAVLTPAGEIELEQLKARGVGSMRAPIPTVFDLEVLDHTWCVTLLPDAAGIRVAVLSRDVWRATAGDTFVEVEHRPHESKGELEARLIARIRSRRNVAIP